MVRRGQGRAESVRAKNDYKKWNQNGKDAAYIILGVRSGRIDPEDFDAFARNHRNLLGKGRYLCRNLRDNFRRAVARWKTYLDHGTDKNVESEFRLLLSMFLTTVLLSR